MRDMLDILRESGWRELAADLLGMIAICVMLYVLVVVASGLQS